MASEPTGAIGGDWDSYVKLYPSGGDKPGPTGGDHTDSSGLAAQQRDQTAGKLGPTGGLWEPEMLGLAMEML